MWPLVIKSLPALYGAGLVLFVIRILPPGEFGRYGISFAYINLLAVLTRGLWAIPLITWAAKREERNVLGPVFWLSLGTASLSAAGAFIILPLLDVSGWLPVMSATMLVVLIPRELGYAIAQAHGRYRVSFALEAVYFLGSLAAFFTLYLAGRLQTAEITLAVNLACAALSSLIAWLVFVDLRRPRISGDWSGVIRFGRWIGLMGLSEVYLQQGDALLLGAFASPAHIAPYLAARTLMRLFALFSQAINFIVLPVSSRLAAAGELGKLRARLRTTIQALLLALIPLNVVLWLASPYLFPAILGAKYSSAIPFFRILLISTFLEPVYSILGNAVSGIGRPNGWQKHCRQLSCLTWL